MPNYVKAIDLIDGMVLAEDIKNRQGYLMLSKGIVLMEKHKKVFQTWNIPGVLVESAEDNIVIDPVYFNKAKLYLESVMTWQCSHPVELDMFDVAVKNLASKLSRNEQSRT